MLLGVGFSAFHRVFDYCLFGFFLILFNVFVQRGLLQIFVARVAIDVFVLSFSPLATSRSIITRCIYIDYPPRDELIFGLKEDEVAVAFLKSNDVLEVIVNCIVRVFQYCMVYYPRLDFSRLLVLLLVVGLFCLVLENDV